MIPFRDENPSRTVPFVTVALIAANCIAFLWQTFSPFDEMTIAALYGAIPYNLASFSSTDIAPQPISPFMSVFSAMFLHGNILHLGGNMLYLWVFGDNVEDILGRVRFLLFYFFTGIVATYAFAFTTTDPLVPMIGASGAVSGILGAYLLLFPSARIMTFVFLGFFWITRIPAVVVISFWAVLQLINGLMSQVVSQQGGVAWFAHLGGFLAGLFTIKLWVPGKSYRRF